MKYYKIITSLIVTFCVGISTFHWLLDASFTISSIWFGLILFILLFKGFNITNLVEEQKVRNIILGLEKKNIKHSIRNIEKSPKELLKIQDLRIYSEGNLRLSDIHNFSTDLEEQLLKWAQFSLIPLILTGVMAHIQSSIKEHELGSSSELILFIKTVAVILPIVYGVAYFYTIIIYLRKKNKKYIISSNNV